MMRKLIILLTLVSSCIGSDSIESTFGKCEVQINKENAVLILNLKQTCSLSFSDKKSITFSEGQHRIFFKNLKDGVGFKADDAYFKYADGIITDLIIKNNTISFFSIGKERIWISLTKHISGTTNELKKIRELADAFVRKKKLNWGQISSISYQNNFKRYVIKYEPFYDQKIKVNYIRALFINEFNWEITEVPNL